MTQAGKAMTFREWLYDQYDGPIITASRISKQIFSKRTPVNNFFYYVLLKSEEKSIVYLSYAYYAAVKKKSDIDGDGFRKYIISIKKNDTLAGSFGEDLSRDEIFLETNKPFEYISSLCRKPWIGNAFKVSLDGWIRSKK